MRCGIIVSAGVILMLLVCQASAQTNPPRNNRNKSPAPVNRNDSAKARKQIADAEVALGKAKEQFSTIRGTLRKDFENSAEWKTAQESLKQAQADSTSARAAVLEQLKSKPEYQSALQRKAKAEADRDAIQDEPPGSARHIEAATAVLSAAQQVTDLESAAMNADPAASESRKTLTAAADKVAQLNKQFEDTLKTSPKYESADKAVTDAEKKLAEAKAALATAADKEAAAERERQRKIDAAAERQRQQDLLRATRRR